jgi:pSer/pThr/pTyr-binding forkhead associated (FHA) protein
VASTPASPKLIGTTGPYAGQTFILSPRGATSVGREDGRDIVLSMDTTVSRRHARIADEGGRFVVYDEGSSNGTTVNGMPITCQPLAPGDVVQFGAAAFRFE